VRILIRRFESIGSVTKPMTTFTSESALRPSDVLPPSGRRGQVNAFFWLTAGMVLVGGVTD